MKCNYQDYWNIWGTTYKLGYYCGNDWRDWLFVYYGTTTVISYKNINLVLDELIK